ncbi:MAG: DUF3109 family protein [Bacteroidota bacterium]|jgi:hypothetical protein
MIGIGDTLVSDDVFEKHFVCNLHACKGSCCVQGDSGAPLLPGESAMLQKHFEEYSSLMTEEGRIEISRQGFSVTDEDQEEVTPLIGEKGACAYVYYEHGIAGCSIEKAALQGLTKAQKPLSCHLYPIRIAKLGEVTALNYHRWEVCSPATVLGKQQGIPVFRFLKNALIRHFGDEYYREMENIYENYFQKKNNI